MLGECADFVRTIPDAFSLVVGFLAGGLAAALYLAGDKDG